MPFALPVDLVEGCLLDDQLFVRAWTDGPASLTVRERRGRLSVDVGTIAESVATLLLQEAGLEIFAELATAGVHGVDLLALTRAGEVVAIEVKGTFRRGAVPRLGRGRLLQMSLEWLSSPANPAMVEWGLEGADVYAAILVVDFADRSWRVALTRDYETFRPVLELRDLDAVA
jgi:Holliday junction resolvase-like predicted endonuclease